jgi:hypothetical protein
MEDIRNSWSKEPGSRIEGSRDLDISKLQAPCIVHIPTGGYRLFYTAVGPAKPFRNCQGYILSAVSEDGLVFHKEPGIRLAPQPELAHMSLRIIAPSVAQQDNGLWRIYFEARGPADMPTVICSAVSTDMLHWEHEEGIRFQLHGVGDVRSPRYIKLSDGQGRLYCVAADIVDGIKRTQVISAETLDGLTFTREAGCRMHDGQSQYDSMGITAAEVVPPDETAKQYDWIMFYSVWQDVPPGTIVPTHPSHEDSLSYDFAAASIASDMAGYRSRIFRSYSKDGLEWEAGECVIEGGGYDSDDVDAVHAEDMSLIKIDDHQYRMYYASCDKNGIWRIASAITE